jgi:aspartokinase-like uncharacterized kinase
MWVVKIGGSLCTSPLLPEWLKLLCELGGGRVTLVCGGGGFADTVRRAQAHWQFDDLPAHNMAVLAMAQSAYLLHALHPELQLTVTRADIRRVLHRSGTALWLPMELLRQKADPQTNWDATSDSIALDLAMRLHAERLVLIKSCEIDPDLSLQELSEAGVLDNRFPGLAAGAAFPIELLHKDELERMRALLLGEVRLMA